MEDARSPAGWPAVCHLPCPRNPNFTGRAELLERLHTALNSGWPAARAQAITGLGGVGKTQLALEYAYRYASDYRLVWWLRAETAAKLAGDFAALAARLALPEQEEKDQRVVREAVRRWLEQNPGCPAEAGWLLIFDNAREPEEVRGYLPPARAGHVLLTSRNPHWGELAAAFAVRPFERDESVRFLLRRTGQSDQAAADALAELLGDLPLALAQAGAYTEETGRPLADYVALFRESQRELLRRGRPSPDYPATVATTWELSFAEVQRTSPVHGESVQGEPVAADLLHLLAFLAPDDVPRDLLGEETAPVPRPRVEDVRNPAAFLPPPAIARDLVVDTTDTVPESLARFKVDAAALAETLAVLRRYSLLEVFGDGIYLHRLVQAVARDRLSNAGRRKWAGVAVAVVSDAFPYQSKDVLAWPKCTRLLPHALAAAEHAQALQVAPKETLLLLNRAGLYLAARALYREAEALQRRALALAEATYGPEHLNVADILTNLGNLRGTRADLEGARAHYQGALRIVEKTLSPRHPLLAVCLNNLGAALRDLGEPTTARRYLERALAIDEAAYGPNHPEVATDLNSLGRVLLDLGDLAASRACFERALRIDESAYGARHPRVALRLSSLGSLLKRAGEFPGARAHFERALAIDEAAYGSAHPSVAANLTSLAGLLEKLGERDAARTHYAHALRILRQRFGPDHPAARGVEERLTSLTAPN